MISLTLTELHCTRRELHTAQLDSHRPTATMSTELNDTYNTMPAAEPANTKPRGRRVVLAAAALSFCLGAAAVYAAPAASKTLRGSTNLIIHELRLHKKLNCKAGDLLELLQTGQPCKGSIYSYNDQSGYCTVMPNIIDNLIIGGGSVADPDRVCAYCNN